jgi:transcriptional regulator with XRE-family HTH domain
MGEIEPVIDIAALRALREARGMDQQTLAAQAGIAKSVVSRLERGHQKDFRASVLIRLAQTLGTTVDALLLTPEPPPQPTFSGELAAVLPDVQILSRLHQRRIAALLRAYLSVMPDPDAPAS